MHFTRSGPTTSRPRRRRQDSWPLARLVRECRSSPAIWLALVELAAGRTVVTPTRERLSDLTGIRRLQTISAALTALEQAGWIRRIHVPKFEHGRQTATCLRIILYRERNTVLTSGASVANAFRSKSRKRKAFSDSTTVESAPAPARYRGPGAARLNDEPSDVGTGVVPSADGPTAEVVPSDPLTGIPIATLLLQAKARCDDAELERLGALIGSLPEVERHQFQTSVHPQAERTSS